MKSRRAVMLVWMVGLVLTLAIPAEAKGVNGVTITGSGGSVTLTGSSETGDDPALSDLVASAGILDQWSDTPPTASHSGDLGSAITLEWRFPTSAGSTVVVEVLYLDAEGGPIGHVLAGQELFDEAWFPLRASITDDLAAAGFDVTAQATAGSATGSNSASEGHDDVRILVLVATVVAAGAAVMWFTTTRRRNQRTA